jgi:hypothetical protein
MLFEIERLMETGYDSVGCNFCHLSALGLFVPMRGRLSANGKQRREKQNRNRDLENVTTKHPNLYSLSNPIRSRTA